METARIRGILMAGLVAVLGLSGYYYFAAAGPAAFTPPSVLPSEADAAIRGFRLSRDQGATTWDLTAETMALYQDGNKARLQEVRLVVKASGGRTYTLTGERGSMDMQTKDIEVRGQERDVVIVTNDGYRFVSSRLLWNEKDQTITTDAPVQLHGPEVDMQGRGLVAHVETQRVEILQDVQTFFHQGR